MKQNAQTETSRFMNLAWFSAIVVYCVYDSPDNICRAQVCEGQLHCVTVLLCVLPLLMIICLNSGDDCAEHELVQALLRENDHTRNKL